MSRRRLLLALATLAALRSPARGQELAVPPALKQLVPAEVPPGTVFPSPVVEVVLEIAVDAAGRVETARVAEGAGEPFDSAALAAAGRFEFEPGRLTTGEAVPVTVSFRLRIEAPPAPPPPIRYRGVLLERGSRRPLAGVDVIASAGDVVVGRVTTDAEGRFALEVGATRFRLRAAPPNHERLDAEVEARPGEEREENLFLDEEGGGFQTVVRTSAPRREVTRQVIRAETVTTIAGTSGDTLKAVQNLPGVARASFGAGSLILRGASPGDSSVFLEGQQIPLLYHFGGLRSTFNSAFLEAVELYPGNFAPDYGRALGGIVEVRVRRPATDGLRGQVDLNLYDAGFVLEGPLSDRWSLGGAFHRSYIDTLLPLFLPDDASLSFDRAPRYYDFQAVASYRPSARHELRLYFYGARDSVALLFDEPQRDPTVRGAISAAVSFYTLQAAYRSPLGAGVTQETSVSLGLQEISTEIGPDYFFDLGVRRASLRSTLSASPRSWLGWRAGIDVQLADAGIALQVPDGDSGEGQPGSPAAVNPVIAVDTGAVLYTPAAFVEARLRPIAPLLLLPSLRADWFGPIRRWAFDPRLAARYELGAATAVAAGLGIFQQPPGPDQANQETGNPDLLPERSVHASLGVDQKLGPLEVQVTGFYKRLDRLVARNPARTYDASAPRFLNDGEGRIYGVEALLKGRLGERVEGWLSYTFQRSLRRDRPGDPERRFDFDQPHILTLVSSFRLGAGFSGSLRFRLVSGNPATPVVGSVYDAVADVYVPAYGAVNSERLGTFHQLDARLDRVWSFRSWKLAIYLDVQNAYNRANPEGWRYRYDYSSRAPVTGLPILPILGVRGEF